MGYSRRVTAVMRVSAENGNPAPHEEKSKMGRTVLPNSSMKWPPAKEYATSNDFQELFACEMADLFRLAFLLTADAERAEQCLFVTIDECMASNSVVKWWLPVWTRNTLIRNAIRIVTSTPIGPSRNSWQRATLTAIRKSQESAIDASNESPGLLLLNDFERLVYVISMIEHYPARDCAKLLGRSRQEVRDALNRAAGQVAAFEQGWRQTSRRTSMQLAGQVTRVHPALMTPARILSHEA